MNQTGAKTPRNGPNEMVLAGGQAPARAPHVPVNPHADCKWAPHVARCTVGAGGWIPSIGSIGRRSYPTRAGFGTIVVGARAHASHRAMDLVALVPPTTL